MKKNDETQKLTTSTVNNITINSDYETESDNKNKHLNLNEFQLS